MDLVPFLLTYSILSNRNHNIMQLSTVFLHTGNEESENEINSQFRDRAAENNCEEKTIHYS